MKKLITLFGFYFLLAAPAWTSNSVNFLLAPPAFAAITVGTAASVNGTSSGGANTITLSCNAGAASNRVVFAAVGWGQDAPIGDITYAGQSMGAHIGEEGDAATSTIFVRLYKLVNPASGTNDLVLDFTGVGTNTPAFLACIPMDGVDQTTPNDAHVAGDSSGSPMSTSTSSATGDMVLDVIMTRTSSASPTLVVGAGQTARVLHDDETLAGSVRQFGMSTEPGGATIAMGWTGANIGAWVQIVINVNAAAGGGGGGSTIRHRVIQQ